MRMIVCNACKKAMYEDSRTEKGSYFDLWVDHSHNAHLCRECFKKRLGDIFGYVLGEEEEEEETVDQDNYIVAAKDFLNYLSNLAK